MVIRRMDAVVNATEYCVGGVPQCGSVESRAEALLQQVMVLGVG
jgi:hypothetical protein